jgi:colicin import membrane protein
MNRLQKKCVIVSSGFHLLLFAILLFGPAFLPSKEQPADTFEVLQVITLKTTDGPTTGGGTPTAPPAPPVTKPPEPAPPAPAPKPEVKPEPKPEVKPEPKPPVVKPEPVRTERAPSPVPDVVDTKPKSKLPDVNLDLHKGTRPNKSTRRPTNRDTEAEEEIRAAQAARAAARQRAEQFALATSALRRGFSSATAVDVASGPGIGSGPAATNFKQAVFSIYYNAWEPPSSITKDNAIAKATVTIDRDGTVINARVTTPSGDAAMDASVWRTLQRVKFAAPLPEGTRESQRTLTIVFDLQAKRGTG